MDRKYRVGIVGCGRMGGTIDDELGESRAGLPYSHAAAYKAVANTILVAAADTKPQKLASFCKRYGVDRCYTDYREMIDREKLDILSVTTPAASHAEATVFAAEHGVKGVYCEKAMACSLAEADAMKEACRGNKTAFNLGTSRRYNPGFQSMRELILGGTLGAPRSLVHPVDGSLLLHTGSHCFDTILFLLGDPEVEYVQATLGSYTHANGTVSAAEYDPTTNCFQGRNAWESDPAIHHAAMRFNNDVLAHVIMTTGRYDFQVMCEQGTVSCSEGSRRWELELLRKDRTLEAVPFPDFTPASSTVRCINDLICAIEAGTLGHLETSHRGMEIAIAAAQSHIEGGRRIKPPVTNRSLLVPNH